MPVRINVANNTYAQRVYNELKGPKGLQPDIPVAEQQQDIAGGDDHSADGLLTRTLQKICREKGAESAVQLQKTYVATTVNLKLDHSDEVDCGASTSKMDDDWVNVDFTSELLKGPEKKEESADQVAQRTMAALEDVTVDQIAAAYKDLVEGKNANEAKKALEKALYEGEEGSVGGKITAAIKAQEKLRYELRSIRCNLLKLGNKGDASALECQAMRASSRVKFLKDLVIRTALHGNGAVNKQGAADKTAAVVDALSIEMLSENDRTKREATEKAVRILDEQLADLGQAYASLAGKKGEQVSPEELDQLEQGLAEAKNVLAGAKGGIVLLNVQTGETQTLEGFDGSVLHELEKRIDMMSASVARLRADALNASIKKVYDEFPFDLLDSPIFSDAYIEKRYEGQPNWDVGTAKVVVATFRNDLTDLKTALDECRQSGDATHALQVAERIASADYGTELDDYLYQSGLPNAECEQIRHRLSFIIPRGGGTHDTEVLKTLIGRFADMVKKANDRGQTSVDGDLLARVLDGSCGLATVASAGAWGADVELLEEGVDDRNLVHCRELGEGCINKVSLCTYRRKDGTTIRRVFKPELPARRGWSRYYFSVNQEIGRRAPLQQVAMTNVTVHKVAEELGIGHSVVGAHLGVHDGQFGLMMDVAEGVTGLQLNNLFSHPPKDPEKVMVGEMSLKDLMDILSANGDEARKFVGNLRHAFTDLDWIDRITGQFDRNSGNYMISVGHDLSVKVTGIDNDLCFPDERRYKEPVYPNAISQGTYDKLKSLSESLAGNTNEEARRILSEKLGRHDLTDVQLDAMVVRIHEAFQAASADSCEKIPDDGNWLNMEKLTESAEKQEDLKPGEGDLFTQHVLKYGMLSQPYGSDGGFLAPLESDNRRRERSRTNRLLGIVRDQNRVDRMVQNAAKGDPAVSGSEMQAFLALLAKEPADVLEYLAEKAGAEDSEENTENALVDLCRENKRSLLEKMRDKDLNEKDPFVRKFLPQYFRLDKKDLKDVELHFAEALETVQRRPLSNDKLAWLADGGAIELAPFIRELLLEFKRAHREDVDGGLIAEALFSELEGMHDEPDEAEVGRLRRLVFNKLNVTPSEVLTPEEAKGLDEQQQLFFRTLCARTPAGKDYYAKVKEEFLFYSRAR